MENGDILNPLTCYSHTNDVEWERLYVGFSQFIAEGKEGGGEEIKIKIKPNKRDSFVMAKKNQNLKKEKKWSAATNQRTRFCCIDPLRRLLFMEDVIDPSSPSPGHSLRIHQREVFLFFSSFFKEKWGARRTTEKKTFKLEGNCVWGPGNEKQNKEVKSSENGPWRTNKVPRHLYKVSHHLVLKC